MLVVQIVGIALIVTGFILLIRAVGTESNVQVPGVTIKAPSSVLVLLVGVAVFLFPFTPWWPAGGAGPTPKTGEATATVPPATATPPQPTVTPTVTPPPATPVPAAFAGTWKNTDPNTRGVVQVDIASMPTGWSVHPWGSCTPTACDWGTETAVVPPDALTFDVTWTISFAVRSQHYALGADGTLAVRTMTHFTDSSGRPDYTSEETFAKTS